VIIFLTMIFFPFILLSHFSQKLYKILSLLWSRSILKTGGIRIKIFGIENIPSENSFLFLANHASLLDIPVLMSAIPHNFRMLAKKELFKIPIFGQAIRATGFVPINRANREKAFQSLQLVADRLREGQSFVIFPEGTRSIDGHLQAFKKGPFYIAIKAGIPVVPTVIIGTHRALAKNSMRINPGTVEIHFGQPVSPTPYALEEMETFKNFIWKSMNERLIAYGIL